MMPGHSKEDAQQQEAGGDAAAQHDAAEVRE